MSDCFKRGKATALIWHIICIHSDHAFRHNNIATTKNSKRKQTSSVVIGLRLVCVLYVNVMWWHQHSCRKLIEIFQTLLLLFSRRRAKKRRCLFLCTEINCMDLMKTQLGRKVKIFYKIQTQISPKRLRKRQLCPLEYIIPLLCVGAKKCSIWHTLFSIFSFKSFVVSNLL